MSGSAVLDTSASAAHSGRLAALRAVNMVGNDSLKPVCTSLYSVRPQRCKRKSFSRQRLHVCCRRIAFCFGQNFIALKSSTVMIARLTGISLGTITSRYCASMLFFDWVSMGFSQNCRPDLISHKVWDFKILQVVIHGSLQD